MIRDVASLVTDQLNDEITSDVRVWVYHGIHWRTNGRAWRQPTDITNYTNFLCVDCRYRACEYRRSKMAAWYGFVCESLDLLK